MKKLISILVLIAVAISCSEKSQVSPNANGKDLISDHVLKNTALTSNDAALVTLKNSSAWADVPQTVLDRIDSKQSPVLSAYDNSPVQTISFSMKSSMNFESLIFYAYEGKYLSAIAKSIPEGDLTRLSVTDTKDAAYYEFYVNKENKVGKFKFSRDIPFNQIIASKDLTTFNFRTESAPCTQTTSSFGACMKCGIAECADDWVCAVACGVMATYCLVGFGISCAVAQV